MHKSGKLRVENVSCEVKLDRKERHLVCASKDGPALEKKSHMRNQT